MLYIFIIINFLTPPTQINALCYLKILYLQKQITDYNSFRFIDELMPAKHDSIENKGIYASKLFKRINNEHKKTTHLP